MTAWTVPLVAERIVADALELTGENVRERRLAIVTTWLGEVQKAERARVLEIIDNKLEIARGLSDMEHHTGALTWTHKKRSLEEIRDLVAAGLECRPVVVCLCGSERFQKTFLEVAYLEASDGRIVLAPSFLPASPSGDRKKYGAADRQRLDALHRERIALADEVLVVNVGGYVGESTAKEIEVARSLGKKVRFLERSGL